MAQSQVLFETPAYQIDVYKHQVGEHVKMLHQGEMLLKPVKKDSMEIKFYDNIPTVLKPHTPEFRGITRAFVPDGESQLRFKPYCNIEHLDDQDKNKLYSFKVFFKVCIEPVTMDNVVFLLLEDITKKFKSPCVFDLKIGFNYFETKEEEKKYYGKYPGTTTDELAIRHCGMQLFTNGKWHIENKAYGGKLDQYGLYNSIRKFFGCKEIGIKISVVLRTIEKLKELYHVIRSLKGYRFYKCSVLIVYDGDSVPGVPKGELVDVRIVDFAKAKFPLLEVPTSVGSPSTSRGTAAKRSKQEGISVGGYKHLRINPQDPDKDFLFGLSKLIKMLYSLIQ